MEGTQIFSCKSGNNMKNLFVKNNDAMFLKVENNKISGKGYVCNTEGKNGYIDEFEVAIDKISGVGETTYLGEPALAVNTRLDNLYGSKKVQLVFPQMKNIDLALKLLRKLREENGAVDEAPKAAPAPAAAAPAPGSAMMGGNGQGYTPTTSYTPGQQAPNAFQQQVASGSALMPKVGATPGVSATAGASAISAATVGASTIAAATPASTPVTPTPKPVQPAPIEESEDEESRRNEDEFNERMEKLQVLKDCGILGEKEYNAKKFELVSQFCDLTDFNEKIQKLVVLKDCGLLSEKEFDANRTDIIKECCDTDANDTKTYRKNIQKLVYLQIGGIITDEEYEKNKQIMVDDVSFKLTDSPELFMRKLKRLPVLRDCQMITDKEYREKVESLYKLIEIDSADPNEVMVSKMNKWPILVQARYITEADLQEKQMPLLESCMKMPMNSPADIKAVIERLVTLKDGNWLSETDFEAKKRELSARIDAVPDYETRIKIYVALPTMGFVTADEYEAQKQRCIDEIFSTYSGMDEFKKRVNNLLTLHKAGMLTEEEFISYKTKLMSDL